MFRRRAAAEKPPHSTTRPKTVKLVNRSMGAADYPPLLDDPSQTSGIIVAATMAHLRSRARDGLTNGDDAMRQPTAILTAGILLATLGPTAAHDVGKETPAFTSPLPNVPGHSLTAIVVSYGPGGKSPVHQHAGSVYAYVLTGAIRSENSATGPARIYKAGESFFEPPGSTHLVSENASATKPASLLAVFVADDGATLTFPPK